VISLKVQVLGTKYMMNRPTGSNVNAVQHILELREAVEITLGYATRKDHTIIYQ